MCPGDNDVKFLHTVTFKLKGVNKINIYVINETSFANFLKVIDAFSTLYQIIIKNFFYTLSKYVEKYL